MTIKEAKNLKPGDKIAFKNSNLSYGGIKIFKVLAVHLRFPEPLKYTLEEYERMSEQDKIKIKKRENTANSVTIECCGENELPMPNPYYDENLDSLKWHPQRKYQNIAFCGSFYRDMKRIEG